MIMTKQEFVQMIQGIDCETFNGEIAVSKHGEAWNFAKLNKPNVIIPQSWHHQKDEYEMIIVFKA